MERREFVRSLAWGGALALCGGCSTRGALAFGGAGQMSNFAVAPMKKIRVGFIGIGERGTAAVRRVTIFPNVEAAALCDLRPEAVDEAVAWLKKERRPGALHEYKGTPDIWKRLCDDPEVDVVYIVTPANLHVEMELYALRAGKHVLCEVPGARTVEECWEIVETCEKVRRHCMMLENCCYGETEMLAWNLVHKGLLGTLTHAEGGYIHNLTERALADHFRNRAKKASLRFSEHGNTYPTHPLGPICFYMDMNRGDRMDYLVSVTSREAGWTDYIRETFKPEDWQSKLKYDKGDINTTVIKTAVGRTIMLQLDKATPRPYSRINMVQGSRGCFADYPPRLSMTKRSGTHAGWLSAEEFEKVRKEHMHPLWKHVGKEAKVLGGHGGMDFIMDLRWVYCLQNGLPLDMDVYDLASWSSIVPCSAESELSGSKPVKIPDFTRGAWKTAKPVTIGDVDLVKMGFDPKVVRKDDKQLSV